MPGGLPRENADARVRFVVVNVDEPGNRHFVGDDRLDSSSLVLAVWVFCSRTPGWSQCRALFPSRESPAGG